MKVDCQKGDAENKVMPRTKQKNGQELLILAVLIPVVLFFTSAAIPLSFFWGFNHLKYFPSYAFIIYATLFLLILIPSVRQLLSKMLTKIVDIFKRLPRLVQILLSSAITAALLYLLRAQVHSLGDGYQRIYQIKQGYMYYYSEPLDFYIHALLFRIFNLFDIASAELTYTSISIVSGIIFIVTVILFKLPEQIDSNLRGLLKTLLVSLGGIQLFFGYVESYTLLYLFVMLHLLYAIRFLYDKKGLLLSSVFLALAISSHITALFLVPSYIYLVYFNFKEVRPKKFTEKFLPLIIVFLVVTAVIIQEIWLRLVAEQYVVDIAGGILPLLSSSEYSILSLIHLLDFFNEILLIAPISIALIIYFILSSKSNSTNSYFNHFFLISGLFSFLFLFLIDPKLGYARDWDLFSTAASVFTFSIASYMILNINSESLRKTQALLFGGVAVIFISIWILTNASEDRQLNRDEELLSLSESGQGYGLELLAYHYRYQKKDSEKSLQLLNRIKGPARNARVYNKIAQTELDLGRTEDALKSIYRGLHLDSNIYNLQALAGVTWLDLERPEKALPHLKKAFLLDRSRFEIMHSIGGAYFMLDSLPQAAMAFKEVLKINPTFAPACYEAGNMYRMLKMYDSALVYAKRGLKLNPNYPNGVQLLETINSEIRAAGRQ